MNKLMSPPLSPTAPVPPPPAPPQPEPSLQVPQVPNWKPTPSSTQIPNDQQPVSPPATNIFLTPGTPPNQNQGAPISNIYR
jgi:hypothetical protein